jgi:hypothetical protein
VVEVSAETLRRAAAVMRERAEAATPGPWDRMLAFGADFIGADAADERGSGFASARWILRLDNRPGRRQDKRNAEHIASWHPAVALLAAQTLEQHADLHDSYDCLHEPCAAMEFASAYLEESS